MKCFQICPFPGRIIEFTALKTGDWIFMPIDFYHNYLYTCVYLHSPTISLDEPILDRRGSYTDERLWFKRRHA